MRLRFTRRKNELTSMVQRRAGQLFFLGGEMGMFRSDAGRGVWQEKSLRPKMVK